MALLDSALCTFTSLAPSLLLETLLVQQWQGEEGLSQPYRFEIRLATLNPLFDDEALLGNKAVLTLSDEKGIPHPYHGIVSAVDYLDADAFYHYYRVVLEPRFAQLRHFRFSEIWLDKSLPELIREVLKLVDLTVEGPGIDGVPSSAYDFDIRLPSEDVALTQATFTCQFEESSFAFLSRLLEYFGVYYFFEQGPDGEALVLCGDQRYQPKTPSLLTYRRHDSDLDVGHGLAVARSFERKLTRQAATVTLQDFSASNAQVRLQAEGAVAAASLATGATPDQFAAISASPAFVGEQGVYGEHFGSQAQGQWLAERRAQAIGCRFREFHGSGRAAGLRAGYPLLLVGHPRLPFNAAYQVIQVQHEGYQPLPGLGQEGDNMAQDLSTRFIALPENVQFRAPCLTRKPHVQGLLSAVVDGDDDTSRPLLNEHGCYKVSFPFIRGEKKQTRGSAWLRMATMSSGSSHGMHFPLLKGSEVLVSFLGGDPDRPIIVGSVPNSENPNKVNATNATQSGISSPGGHYLAIEDSQSSPLMKMRAPGGNTTFTMGHGDVTGAHLRTNAHMQLSSSSLKQEVPGIYSLKVGSGAPPVSDSPSEPEKDKTEKGGHAAESSDEGTEKWGSGEASWKPGKLAVAEASAQTFSAEAKLALAQAEMSAGALKVELGIQLFSAATKIAGPSVELCLNKWQYSYRNFEKEVRPATLVETLNEEVKTGISKLQTELRDLETKMYRIDAALSIGLSVGGSSIEINTSGVRIKSGVSIILQGDVEVTGSLLVTGGISTAGKVSGASIEGIEAVKAGQIECLELKASTADLATVCVPPIPDPQLLKVPVTLAAFETNAGVVATAQQALIESQRIQNALFAAVVPAP